MKTKARDLIQGWPWPHSTSRPHRSPPQSLISMRILDPPEIPAEVWTYIRLANDAMHELTGAPIKMWSGKEPPK